VLEAPYIRVEATVTQPGITNGKPNIRRETKYIIAPSGKKIATYIVNQVFGSDLVTQTEGLNINWLMPTLKESLELAVYEQESFILIHKFDDKIYLECIKKSDIHDLVQKFDKVISGTIIQQYDGLEEEYELHRNIKIDNGVTYMTMEAYKLDSKGKLIPIDINVFNLRTGNEYLSKYVLPYEILINIDIGQDFFKDSKKFLNEEMRIFNVFADEIEKTKTRIVTTQHYQSGDIVTNWTPANNHYKVDTLTVGELQDYFTLLPGDKEHQMFEFLQGNIRVTDYMNSFKFCDYQCIQMAGLSPASFGYEKDTYQNVDSVDLSKNNSDMTVEAIKTQIEPQINKLLENIVKAQQSNNIQINLLPSELNWDYGLNEKLTDMKKLQVLNRVQSVGSIPYSVKAKIITPILKKLIDDDYDNEDKLSVEKLIEENKKEQDAMKIDYGEV
jgi:hypothetical protein